MSGDEQVAKELVETLRDGERGFASAAEKLRDGDRPEWATTLQRLSEQRAGFHREIRPRSRAAARSTCPPHIDTSGQPLPGPAQPTLQPTTGAGKTQARSQLATAP